MLVASSSLSGQVAGKNWSSGPEGRRKIVASPRYSRFQRSHSGVVMGKNSKGFGHHQLGIQELRLEAHLQLWYQLQPRNRSNGRESRKQVNAIDMPKESAPRPIDSMPWAQGLRLLSLM